MKILILGGSGFVSGTLTKMALEQKHEVWCVTRGNRPLSPDVHPVIADRNDVPAFKKALQETNTRFDCVLDCICFNAEQAEAALTILPEFTDRVVVISTDSVYHPHKKTIPQTEDEYADIYLDDGSYGANKRKMEQVYLADAGKRLTYTIFRPGHIFGEGSKLGAFPELTRRDDIIDIMDREEPLPLVGGGKYLIQAIYAGDLCACMLAAMKNEKTYNKVFCIGGPDIVPNAKYYFTLGRILNRPVTIKEIPEEGYLEAHPQYSGHLCPRAYDLTRLKEAGLPLPATTLEEGLRRQVAYILRQRAQE